jgi:pimeloyl-ACP methyl ester carboxylesterase
MKMSASLLAGLSKVFASQRLRRAFASSFCLCFLLMTPPTRISPRTFVTIWLACLFALAAAANGGASLQGPQRIVLRGHEQTLELYGSTTGQPIIVSSGDGGWIHLGPHVAQLLAARGFYVVGFDVRAYLTSFTTGERTLRAEDEPTDYRVLAQFAKGATGKQPILVGVSEGAGLSALAATDPLTKQEIRGVVAVGMPELNELGWRWKDSLIYVTHKVPNEPTFSAAAIVAGIAPIPFAAIHSTHDEFVPLANIQNVLNHAGEPKQLWIVDASDHRFSNNLQEFDQRLLEAIDWIRTRALR